MTTGGPARLRLSRQHDRYRVERLSDQPSGEPLAVCLNDEAVLYRRLSLPQADPAVLAKMVAGQIEVLLPAQADRLVTAWSSGRDADRPGQAQVLVCAARRETVSKVADTLGRPGRETVVVPTMLAVAAAWTQLGRDADPPAVLVQTDERSTALAVVRDGQVVQAGVLDVGFDHWADRLAAEWSLPVQSARERLLAADGEAEPSFSANLGGQWSRQLREVYEHCVEGLPRAARPARCVLFGPLAGAPWVAAMAEAALGMPAEQAEPSTRLEGCDGDFARDAALIGAALSLLEPGTPATHLAGQPVDRPGAAGRRLNWRVGALVLWIVAALLILWRMDLSHADRLEAQLADLRAEADRQGLDRQLAIGHYLESAAPAPLEVLDRIAQSLPDGALLTSWRYSRDGEVSLGGLVGGEKDFLGLMEKLSVLGEVEYRSAKPDNGRFRFEVRMRVGSRLPAAEQAAKPEPPKDGQSGKPQPASQSPAEPKPAAVDPSAPTPASAGNDGPAPDAPLATPVAPERPPGPGPILPAPPSSGPAGGTMLEVFE